MPKVLITGANKGIGLELAKCYAEAGNTVLACCRAPDDAKDLHILTKNSETKVIGVSVGDDASVKAMALELDGTPIDLIINNAGTMGPAPQNQTAFVMDFDGWADAMNINAMAPVRVMHALLPNLRAAPEAKIMNVTSQLGAISLDMTMAYAYSASKAALNKYMRLAAIELAKENISVGLIHPGWVQTGMGGSAADITAVESASGIVKVISQLKLSNTGGFWKWNGERHPW